MGEHSLKGLSLNIDLGWFVGLCSLIGLGQGILKSKRLPNWVDQKQDGELD